MKTKIFKQNPIYIKENLVLGILSPLLLVLFTVFTSCSSDETQTVATFTEFVMADEFDTDGMLNSTIWDLEKIDTISYKLPFLVKNVDILKIIKGSQDNIETLPSLINIKRILI